MIENSPCKHIIVVDDEAMIRDSLKQLLTLEGYTVECFNDAKYGSNKA